MKKYILHGLFTLLVLISFTANAQIMGGPGPMFKSNYINTNLIQATKMGVELPTYLHYKRQFKNTDFDVSNYDTEYLAGSLNNQEFIIEETNIWHKIGTSKDGSLTFHFKIKGEWTDPNENNGSVSRIPPLLNFFSDYPKIEVKILSTKGKVFLHTFLDKLNLPRI